METARVIEACRYPVKSMGGESLDRIDLDGRGVVGDRAWAVRDAETGEALSGRRAPRLLLAEASFLEDPAATGIPDVEIRLPDGTRLRSDDGAEIDADLSRFLGRAVVLRRQEPGDGPCVDIAPVHVLTTASLEALAARHGVSDLDVRRFRPNVLVRTARSGDGFVESAWAGRRMRLGTAGLRLTAPTRRCRIITAEQPGLGLDRRLLDLVMEEIGGCVGIYGEVVASGTIDVGDVAEVA